MKINKQVFLEELPRWQKGNKAKEGTINWKGSIGYKVRFIYDEIEDWVEIKDYDGKFLYLKYLDYDIFKMNFRSFREGNLGKLLRKITNEFKYKIGKNIKDKKRNIEITNIKYRTFIDKRGYKNNEKWYLYHCNICGWDEGSITEGHLVEGNGCPVCAGQKLVQGINDIPTTNPDMIPYFQGGIEEAQLYTKNGGGNPDNKEGMIFPRCPDCGKVRDKKIRISSIFINHGYKCIYCSDGISFPEKFVFNLLKQINVNFNIQYNPNWINPKAYDFYIPSLNTIVETHGLQHYEEKGWKTSKSLKEEIINDKFKKKTALKNGILNENYITIDCRYSDSEWIKNNIIQSNLAMIFELDTIDWDECTKFALGNKVKEACEYKRNNSNMTTQDIANIIGYHHSTISRWLKKGDKIGWCHYNPKEEQSKNMKRVNKLMCKPVEMFKDEISLGIFESGTEIEKRSIELFGIQLDQGYISKCCLGKQKKHKGYNFKYI